MDVFRHAFAERDAKATQEYDKDDDGVSLTTKVSHRANARRLGVDEEVLRAHVQSHLSTLMNTIRLDAAIDLSDSPHVAQSVVNYGFQDLSNLSRKELTGADIARSIKQSLKDHEPRLIGKTLDVRVMAIEGDPQGRIGVFVAAELIADPADIAIEFTADVDVGAGKVVLNGTERALS